MFDSHVHIIDPRFPLVVNDDYEPEPFTVDDYEAETDGLGVVGGAVVTGSFQGTDQSYLLAALEELGHGWVGVTQLPVDATDDDISALDAAGVRALRFNLRRGVADISSLTEQAIRAHEVAGWHSEFYVDAGLLRSLEPIMSKLPAVSIDHLGMAEEAMPYLLDLVDRGARVKATGFGRISHDPVDAMRRIHAVNPEALMFGTDLPSTRAERRFDVSDLDLVADAVGGDLQAVLFQNARAWYREP
ncbi:2-pyrone-4,6-dicarboxylate hydrolase [Rhodococcus sp. Leaf7]|uniref:amidohydrolase family protein n=1 Tax=unclassified Rhodococcus (in: high G+C Gram-positive bacteria) TaxID=192944 RepID=UPI0006F2BC30|nr:MULTISPECIES: amidohydrolase family protein [unclassified Rhodococcus (in: high G+C Gram-positive bacteria)]KQU04347.1 2-pyrone-4,6-dicarboxylate hydrolase [Rhodococcus sp. Leaf7]KQU40532.1 2-pyrone-4,6-dicarboxylate hydrolase [Rhodococcus sp. Leaf247]